MVKIGLVNVENENFWNLQKYPNSLYYFNPQLQEAMAGASKNYLLGQEDCIDALSELIQEQAVKITDKGVAAYIKTQPLFSGSLFSWEQTKLKLKEKLGLLRLEDLFDIDCEVFNDVDVRFKQYCGEHGKKGYEIFINVDKDSIDSILGSHGADAEQIRYAISIDGMKLAKENAPKTGAALNKKKFRLQSLIDFTKKLENLYSALAKKKNIQLPDSTLLLAPQSYENILLNTELDNIYEGSTITVVDTDDVLDRPVYNIELRRKNRALEDIFDSAQRKNKVVAKPKKGKQKTELGNAKFDSYKPIKEILDRYIIGQESAKLALSEAVCDHYMRSQMSADDQACVRKKNILMIGPTGSGKTYLAKVLAEQVLKVPFVEISMPQMTAAGYVGGDVSSILEELISNAGGNISAAENGIVFLDEIDKIRRDISKGRDIKGDDVQNELLSMLAGETRQTKQGMIDTSNILFICAGAFDGIESCMEPSEDPGCVGFHAEDKKQYDKQKIDAEVLRKYGLKGELIGRLPYVVELEKLGKEQYMDILQKAEKSPLLGEQKLFKQYGIELLFEKSAIERLAELAAQDSRGARALDGLLANVLKGLRDPNHAYVKDGKLNITRDRVDEQISKYR